MTRDGFALKISRSLHDFDFLLNLTFSRFCFLNFKSKAEAERHRKTLSHRTNVKSAKGISTVVKCQFCDDKVEDLARLKEHILDQVMQIIFSFRKVSLCLFLHLIISAINAHAYKSD